MEEKSEKTSAFMTKRMNIPENAEEMSVTEWDNIKATKHLTAGSGKMELCMWN